MWENATNTLTQTAQYTDTSILNLFCQQSTPDVSTVEPLELWVKGEFELELKPTTKNLHSPKLASTARFLHKC